jgi:hypothetical protein
MSKHTLDVPDIVNKGQRVLRTIIQVGIPAFLAIAVVLPQIIQALGLPVDSAVYLWLIGFAGAVTAVAGALARVMAIPAVDTWLTSIGLGSVKKSEARNVPIRVTPADPDQPAAGVPPADA